MKESNLQLDEIQRRRQLKAVEFSRYLQGGREARSHLRMTLTDLEDEPTGPNPLEIAIREIDYTDAQGNPRRIWVLASEPFEIPEEVVTRFYNTEQVLTCPEGEEGMAVVVAAGLYQGSTQEEANAKAVAYGQTVLICAVPDPYDVWTLYSQDWTLIPGAGGDSEDTINWVLASVSYTLVGSGDSDDTEDWELLSQEA